MLILVWVVLTMKLPTPPSMDRRVNVQFIRSKRYTKIDKDVVQCLLFNTQLHLSEIDTSSHEAVKMMTKYEIFNLLFSQKKVF